MSLCGTLKRTFVLISPKLFKNNFTAGHNHFRVNKQKIRTEREIGHLRITGSTLSHEISAIKSELEIINKHLEESKSQMSQARHQLSMIDICTRSEKSKVSSHVEHINAHKEGFSALFNRERVLSEVREKELREKRAEDMELERQEAEQRVREAAALDAESDAIEQACVVLKKRNNAIMLKLRRKLVETEDVRRELLKLKEQTNGNHTNRSQQ